MIAKALKLPALFAGLAMIVGVAVGPPRALGAQADSFATALLSELAIAVESPGSTWHGVDAEAVQTFYVDRDLAPLWTGDDDAVRRKRDLLAAFENAEIEGLDPAEYAEALEAARALDGDSPPEARAAAELLLTAAAVRYVNDLNSGRAAPQVSDPDLFPTAGRIDAETLLWDIASVDDLAHLLRGLAPAHVEYRRLRRALATMRAKAADGGWPIIPEGELLKAGMSDPRVPALAERLRAAGVLAPGTAVEGNVYGPALVGAVTAFQGQHGLAVDGVVGPGTRAALNFSAEDRVDQIILNMERWRWISEELPRRYVWVNLPAFSLDLVEDGRSALRMKIIVGLAYQQTPVFAETMTYLEINPYWNIPYSIASKELLPKIKEDPNYLARENLKVLTGWSENASVLDPDTIEWSRISAQNFSYRLRQEPGPDNALGRIKFMFPNRFSVYLHDTPTRQLFDRARRTFSHGCIRIEQPIALADRLLGPDWTPQRIEGEIAEGRNEVIRLPEPVKVILTYSTAWVDETGEVRFLEDIYGRDERLAAALGLD